ncbi:MAG: hypothetical protein J6033_04330 [Lachnospiraceae bacterium]|nr:hypothetical protein [Lachnospiraceae bacterium]
MKKKNLICLFGALLIGTFLGSCGDAGTSANPAGAESEMTDEAQALSNALSSLNSDGTYTVKKGSKYIGINYSFSDGSYFELMTVCKKDEVVDCARNSALERFMLKEEYLGKTYEDAFIYFYEINSEVEDHGEVEKISLIIMKDDDESKYEKVLSNIRESVNPNAVTEVTFDDEWHFDEVIIDFTEDYVARLQDEENKRAEEAEREKAEEDRIKQEEEKRLAEELERQKEEEFLKSPVGTMDEICERYAKEVRDFTLSKDLTIDFSQKVPKGISIDCNGKNLIVKGALTGEIKKDHDPYFLELKNAGKVDMSGLSLDINSFDPEEWRPEEDTFGGARFDIVTVKDTDYKNVVFPADIPLINEFDGPASIFDEYFTCEINDYGDEEKVTFVGTEYTYEERHAEEVEVVTMILTKGDANDILGGEWHGEYDVWTDVSIDVGTVTLPNQDYMGIRVRPGGKLTVSGFIEITGGKLDFTVSGKDQLDLNGLTIKKSHPSPDMIKVRYAGISGIDESKVKPKASSGTIKFAACTESYDITIW